jgi:hypothetical protein
LPLEVSETVCKPAVVVLDNPEVTPVPSIKRGKSETTFVPPTTILVTVSWGATGGIVHVGPEIVLVSKVTAPFCAKARPFRVAPVFMVIEVSAKIFPINELVVPRVAELPTLHQTLHGSPPVIDELVAAIKVEADLKIQTPEPVRFKFPDNAKLPAEQ